MLSPRVVIVTRPTAYEGLLATHATHGQAAWYLSQLGQDIERYLADHQAQESAVTQVLAAVPKSWKHARIGRALLDRFLFTPDDIVIAVGQDGLVPNVARYALGLPVIGVNPAPDRYEGVLVTHPPEAIADLLRSLSRCPVTERTMVQATTKDGQRLLALNEIFIGHATHQSARYTLTFDGQTERQSSSGLIIATGTGATGWARSIHRCHGSTLALPTPEEPGLAFFVREPWPSVQTGSDLVEGVLQTGESLTVLSEMTEGGRVFGDGVEQDFLRLPWAASVRVSRADEVLRLVG